MPPLTIRRQQQMPHTEHNYLTFIISLNFYKTCDRGILLLLHDGRKKMRLREFKKYAQNEQSRLDLNPDGAPQSAPSLAFHTQYQEVLKCIHILLYWSPSINGCRVYREAICSIYCRLMDIKSHSCFFLWKFSNTRQ